MIQTKPMCSPEIHIKLCTCGNLEQVTNKTWRLVRGSSYVHVVGDFLFADEAYQEFKVGDYLSKKILSDLNSYDVFDFDFRGQDGDTLIIYLNNQEFHYVFRSGVFHIEQASLKSEEGSVIDGGKVRLSQ